MKFFRRKTKSPEDPIKQELSAPAPSLDKEKPASSPPPSGLGGKLKRLFGFGSKLDESTKEALEEVLLLSDAGIETTELILSRLDTKVRKNIEPIDALRQILTDILQPIEKELIPESDPWVVLVVGSNGVGKTTSIAKLANYYMKQGYKPLLAAGDTFRAAATEQLEAWARKLDIPVVSQSTGADSASVIYDSIASAKARGCNIVLADTAGRLHNKNQLLDELEKIKRVAGKAVVGAPHETLLVVDASTGQNALSMTETFHSSIGVTGLIMTKLDGSAKGGTLFSLSHSFSLPVPFIGTGEKIDDFKPLHAQKYVDSILQ